MDRAMGVFSWLLERGLYIAVHKSAFFREVKWSKKFSPGPWMRHDPE